MTVNRSDVILRAVELMKRRARYATGSPWHTSSVWSKDATATSAVYSHAHPAGLVESEVVASGRIKPGYGGIRNPWNAEHIAGMQPSVVLLIAAWMRSCGEELAKAGENDSICDEPGAIQTAYEIAHEYLGGGQ